MADDTILILITEIRREAGKPSEADLDDDDVEAYITEAMAEYFKRRPITSYKAVSVFAGQNEYSVDSDVFDVLDVVFATYSNMEYGSNVLGENILREFRTISLFDNPSLLTIYYQKLESIYSLFDYNWSFSDGKIILSPTPTGSGCMMYKASLNYTIDNVPQKDRALIKKYAIGKCLCQVGMAKAGKNVTKIPTVSGSVQFNDGHFMIERGEALIKQFIGNLGGHASIHIAG